MNAICFKLFWYKVFVHWTLTKITEFPDGFRLIQIVRFKTSEFSSANRFYTSKVTAEKIDVKTVILFICLSFGIMTCLLRFPPPVSLQICTTSPPENNVMNMLLRTVLPGTVIGIFVISVSLLLLCIARRMGNLM